MKRLSALGLALMAITYHKCFVHIITLPLDNSEIFLVCLKCIGMFRVCRFLI